MKFKFKTLFAAVALATSAASANAAIEIGSTTGGSELVFSAWDSVAGVGYTYDLLSSLKLESFIGADAAANATGNVTMLANAVVSNSLITGPNGQILDVALTGFPFTSNIANVEWNLNAVDFTGRNRLLTTKDITDLNPFASNSNQVRNAATGMNSYYSQANAFAVDANDDTYSLTVAADGAAYAGNYGSGWVNNLGDTTNVMGAQSFVFLAAQPTQSSSAVAGLFKQMATANGENLVVSTYQEAGQWRLNLSVAAIPEPETYAMFLAGLGMMGAVARRRKGQVK
jgi:hypothetical protein